MTLNMRGIAVKLLILPAIAFFGFAVLIAVSEIGGQFLAEKANQIVSEGEQRAARFRRIELNARHAIALVRAAPAEFDATALGEAKTAFESALTQLEIDFARGAYAGMVDAERLAGLREVGLQVFGFAEQFAQAQAVEVLDGAFSVFSDDLFAGLERIDQSNKDAAKAILVDMETAQISTTVQTISTGLIAMILVVGFGIHVARKLSQRMEDLQNQMSRLSEGDTNIEIVGADAEDELGRMANALLVFKENLIAKRDMEQKQLEREESERLTAAETERLEQERKKQAAQEEAKKVAEQTAERERLQQEAERERQVIMARQTRVLEVIGAGMRKISVGQLEAHIEEGDVDQEFNDIRSNFNEAIEGLRDIVTIIAKSGTEIQSASIKVAESTDNISKRGEKNASALEETASALNELTAMIEVGANKASQASNDATHAREQAEAGAAVIIQTIEAVSNIEKASGKISNIVDMIDGIAFQTNLLALNAGVEAARAGEAGRGFAVVANEVRALAGRASDAASDINALIADERKHVENGTALVKRAGESLNGIAASALQLENKLMEVATSAEDQSRGILQISSAVEDLEKATQQNSAILEDTNVAAQALKSTGIRLDEAVGRFDLGESSSSSEKCFAAE